MSKNKGREMAGRSLGQGLFLVSLVVISLSLLAFVQSNPGRRTFVDHASQTSLLRTNSTGGATGPILRESAKRHGVKRLGTVELDAHSRYLLVAELGKGGRVTFVGSNGETQVKLRCPARPRPEKCDRVFSARGFPGEFRFRVLHHGKKDLDLSAATVARLSPVYFWIRPVLLAILCLAPIGFLVRYRRRLTASQPGARLVEDVALAVMLFGLLLLAFHRAPVHQVIDSRFLTAVSHSLIHDGDIVLPDDFSASRQTRRYQIDRIDGKLLHHFSPVPAVLDVPVFATYERLGVTPEREGGRWNFEQELRIMRFSAAFVSALLCVVLYATARLSLAPLPALGLTLVFALGTQIMSTLSRAYWSHTWGALLAATAILLVIRPWRRIPNLSAALAAVCISLAFFSRPQIVWTVVGLVALLALSRDRRRLATFLIVGGLCAAAGALMSLAIYGSVLPPYFFSSQVARGHFDAGSLNSYRYLTGTLGALVSPGRGLFIYSPIYLWALYQVIWGWKAISNHTVAAVALTVIAGHLLLLVHTGVWPGGRLSYGARQFSDVLVWFFLLAVLATETVQRRWPTLNPTRRRVQVAVLSVAIVFSVFVNLRGSWSRATRTWRSYDRPPAWLVEGREPLMPQPEYWNWRYPQFMAGLLPLDSQQPASGVP